MLPKCSCQFVSDPEPGQAEAANAPSTHRAEHGQPAACRALHGPVDIPSLLIHKSSITVAILKLSSFLQEPLPYSPL